MRGGMNAEYIDREYKKMKAYQKKKRQKCFIDNKKQCDICQYNRVCLDSEVEDNEEMD